MFQSDCSCKEYAIKQEEEYLDGNPSLLLLQRTKLFSGQLKNYIIAVTSLNSLNILTNIDIFKKNNYRTWIETVIDKEE